MKRWPVIFISLLLLAGCSSVAASVMDASEQAPDSARTPAEGEPVTVLTIPLAEAATYEPWGSMEPDIVPDAAAGAVLCDKTLPDGTEVICFWEDGPASGVKYWAIRRDGALLRFFREESFYAEGYDVAPFTDVLGRDGFRIVAPRGAAYTAYDYYVLDDTGTPRLLADCANYVLESDFNSDGVTELMWFYHGGQEIYYYYTLLDGQICFADITSALEGISPIYFCGVDLGLFEEYTDTLSAGSSLPVTYLPCGGTPWDGTTADPVLPARLRFDSETVELQIPEERQWTMNCYALQNGVPCVMYAGETAWTALGPAVSAPGSWASQSLADRNRAEIWSDIEPDWTALRMVSARDGWLVLSVERGVAAADTYIYRTHDGGVSWEEASPLPEDAWLPAAAAFLDEDHAVIATELWEETPPVYTTADGGRTWTAADLPLPETGGVWRTETLDLSDDTLLLYMTDAEEGSAGTGQTILLTSGDQGRTWAREGSG